jgi:alpha/beta superfamily hydrolase
MNPASSQPLTLLGGAGPIEALADAPANGVSPRGVAVIAHPHPLHGGAMHNKVVQTLARACAQAGWQAIRFNFRGVGASAGTYDEGRGETQDLLAVLEQTAKPGQPVVLGGFSFGAFVACSAAQVLMAHEAGRPDMQHRLRHLLLAGTAASRFAVPPVDARLHAGTLALHGALDDVVPLADVLDWARPQQTLPVTVVPAGGHFFHGQLPLLKRLVLQHLLVASV